MFHKTCTPRQRHSTLRRRLPRKVESFVGQKPRDNHGDSAHPEWDGNVLHDDRHAEDDPQQMAEGNQEKHDPDSHRKHMLADDGNLLPAVAYIPASPAPASTIP